MANDVVGTAYVQVRPLAEGFQKALSGQVNSAIKSAQAGVRKGKNNDSLARAMLPTKAAIDTQARLAGKDAAESFRRGMKSAIGDKGNFAESMFPAQAKIKERARELGRLAAQSIQTGMRDVTVRGASADRFAQSALPARDAVVRSATGTSQEAARAGQRAYADASSDESRNTTRQLEKDAQKQGSRVTKALVGASYDPQVSARKGARRAIWDSFLSPKNLDLGRMMGSGLASAGRSLTWSVSGAAGLTLGIAGYLGASFESAISRAASTAPGALKDSAIFNSVSKAFADEAKQVAGETIFNPQEAAQGLEQLSKGGLTAKESVAALNTVVDLAVAGDIALADASKIAVTGLNVFSRQMKKTGQSTEQFMRTVGDSLATAANSSNASVKEMGDAFVYAGGKAASMGVPVEELSGSLAILAQGGQIGSKGGVVFNQFLKSLTAGQKETTAAGQAFKKYGVEVYTAEGRLKSMVDITEGLSAAFKGASEQERALMSAELFPNVRAERAADIFREFGKIDKETGKSNIAAMMEEIYEGAGSLEKLEELSMGPTQRAFEQMVGALQELGIALGAAMAPTIIKIADSIKDFATSVSEMDSDKLLTIAKALAGIAATGPALWIAGGTIRSINAIVDGLLLIKPAALKAGSALAALSLVPIGGAGGGVKGLTASRFIPTQLKNSKAWGIAGSAAGLLMAEGVVRGLTRGIGKLSPKIKGRLLKGSELGSDATKAAKGLDIISRSASTAQSSVGGFLRVFAKTASKLLKGSVLFAAVGLAIDGVIEAIDRSATSEGGGFLGNLKQSAANVTDGFRAMGDSVSDVGERLGSLGEETGLATLVGAIQNALVGIVDAVGWVAEAVTSGFAPAIDFVAGAISGFLYQAERAVLKIKSIATIGRLWGDNPYEQQIEDLDAVYNKEKELRTLRQQEREQQARVEYIESDTSNRKEFKQRLEAEGLLDIAVKLGKFNFKDAQKQAEAILGDELAGEPLEATTPVIIKADLGAGPENTPVDALTFADDAAAPYIRAIENSEGKEVKVQFIPKPEWDEQGLDENELASSLFTEGEIKGEAGYIRLKVGADTAGLERDLTGALTQNSWELTPSASGEGTSAFVKSLEDAGSSAEITPKMDESKVKQAAEGGQPYRVPAELKFGKNPVKSQLDGAQEVAVKINVKNKNAVQKAIAATEGQSPQVNVKVTAPNASAVRDALNEVKQAAKQANNNKVNIDVQAPNASAVRDALNEVAASANSIPNAVSVTVSVNVAGLDTARGQIADLKGAGAQSFSSDGPSTFSTAGPSALAVGAASSEPSVQAASSSATSSGSRSKGLIGNLQDFAKLIEDLGVKPVEAALKAYKKAAKKLGKDGKEAFDKAFDKIERAAKDWVEKLKDMNKSLQESAAAGQRSFKFASRASADAIGGTIQDLLDTTLLEAANKKQKSLLNKLFKGAEATMKAYSQRLQRYEAAAETKADLESATAGIVDWNKFVNPADLVKELNRVTGYIDGFATDLSGLRNKGVSDTVIQQLTQMDPAKGATMARYLATASAEQIAALNNAYANYDNAVKDVADKGASASWAETGSSAALGFAKGMQSDEKKLRKQIQKTVDGMLKVWKKALGIKSPSKVTEYYGKMTVKGFEKGIADASKKSDKKNKKRAKKSVKNYTNELKKNLSKAEGALGDLTPQPPEPKAGNVYATPEQVSGALDPEEIEKQEQAAEEALEKQKDLVSKIADEVRNQYNRLQGTVNWSQIASPNQLLREMDRASEDIQKARLNTALLAGKGLNAALQNQINQMDPKAAARFTQRLLDNPSMIAELNRSNEDFANAGRQAAHGIADGVLREQKHLDDVMKYIGTGMSKTLEDVLEIESPSKVFARAGRMVALGVAQGIESEYAAVENSVEHMVDYQALNVKNNRSASGTSGAGSGNTINIEVMPSAGMSTTDLAQKVAREIGWRING